MNKTKAHSNVRVDVHCVQHNHGGHVVIGVGRVIVKRHHANITNQYGIGILNFSPL